MNVFGPGLRSAAAAARLYRFAPLLLLAFTGAASSDASELGEAFDSGGASFSPSTTDEIRLALDLVLADRLSAEGSTADATKKLEELPATPTLRERWPALAAYADALRCVHGIRRGRFGDYAPLCDVAASGLTAGADPLLRSRIHWAQSFRWFHGGRYAEAKSAAEIALAQARSAASARAEAWAWDLLGQLQSESGQTASAVDSFAEASRLASSLEDEALSDIVANSTVFVHLELGNFEEARDVADRRLQWSLSSGQTHRAFDSEVQLARAHLGQGETRAALEILAAPLAGDRTRHDPSTLLRALTVQARAHLELYDTDTALELLRQGIVLAESLSHQPRLEELRVVRVEALAASDRREEALDEARTLRADLEASDSPQRAALLGVLSELAAQDGRFELAALALAERRAAASKVRFDALSMRLAMLEQDYALQRAEREIEVVRQQQSRQQAITERNTAVLGGATVILALLAFTLWLQRARGRQRRLAAEQQYLAKELEGMIDVRSQALELEMLQRQEREAESRAMQARLAEADPKRSLGQETGDFAGVAEELLLAVLTAAEELERSPEMPWPEQRERLRVIRGAASSALEMNEGSRQPAIAALTPSPRNAGSLRGLRALLVEDDDGVRDILVRQLTHLGLEVRTACDGTEGLAMVAASAPDLLVSDVGIPGVVDGIELGKRVRGLLPDLPVLLLSGLEGVGTETGFPLLNKPFSRAKLQVAIEELVGLKALSET